MTDYKFRRYGSLFLLFPVAVFIYLMDFNGYHVEKPTPTSKQIYSHDEYLVYSSKCRIPNLDPWNSEAARFYKQNTYLPCSSKKLLTYVVNNGTKAVLHVDKEAEPLYSTRGVECCYSYVYRGDGKLPDKSIRLSNCTAFEESAALTHNTVLVKCYNKQSRKEIYSNAHSFALLDEKRLQDARNLKNKFNPPSVLFVGIDSLSRLNFHRSLPKTRHFLNRGDWIEYKGYNKIEDNTFPNLMGIFTGRNYTSIVKHCNPSVFGELDKCNFIWYDYRDAGFLTGYAEDEAELNTFNYLKKGFRDPPTDLYYRQYVLAAETLPRKKLDHMTYCAGPESSGERILNAAKDFAVSLKAYPSFGFFWMSTFSHDRINSATRMDDRLLRFFEDVTEAGVLDDSIVVFLSDHGLRFGNIRLTRTGWLEERLPFLYISIPKRFKDQHPKQYANLRLNGGRLTTPYDLHLTLKDVPALYGLNYLPVPSEACPKCSSLFSEAEKERSCEDAAIEMHWCTCTGYKYLNPNSVLARQGAEFVIDFLNENIKGHHDVFMKCVQLKYNKVLSSSISDKSGDWYKQDEYLLLVINTIPESILEATLSIKYENGAAVFRLEGGISRLDYYKFNSECVDTWHWKMYCYCQWNLFLDMNFFNFWFEI